VIRDKEVLELLREEPELLAVADAVGATQRVRQRRTARVPRRRVIALAAVGTAAMLVVVFAQGRGGAPSIVDRALAAVGEGPVLHAITRMPDPSTTARIELSTGRETAPATLDAEMWLHERRGILHVINRRDGRVVDDRAVRYADVAGDPAGAPFDPFQLAGLYRKALEGGHVREVGSGTLIGRRVVWLEARQPAAGDPSREIVWRAALDQESWRLLALRLLVDGKPEMGLDVVKLEALAEGSHVFPHPGPYESPLTCCVSSGGGGAPITLARARDALTVPAVWAGNEVAGEPLGSVGTFAEVFDARTTHGIALTYGKPESIFDNVITVSEVAAGSATDTLPPAKGFIDLSMSKSRGETDDGKTFESTYWEGRLELRGLWITITAPSRAVVLEVARALRPIP
jgi:hypothetical protein